LPEDFLLPPDFLPPDFLALDFLAAFMLSTRLGRDRPDFFALHLALAFCDGLSLRDRPFVALGLGLFHGALLDFDVLDFAMKP
jgi:hypothetical protein